MIKKLFASAVKNMEKYKCADYPADYIKLDANESPYDIPVKLKTKINYELKKVVFNRYPDNEYKEIKNLLKSKLRVKTENLVLGNGSNELLMYILMTFCNPNENVLIYNPTFVMYEHIAKILNLNVIKENLSADFDLTDKFVALSKKAKVVFISYPNNPTGNLFSEAKIKRILKNKNTVVVIDEAYYDFCGKTFLNYINKYENLIVLRTFSKGFSLAALRLGMLIANKEIAQKVSAIRLPYNVNTVSTTIAKTVYSGELNKNVKTIISEKKKLLSFLKTVPGACFVPSESNFIFCRFKKAGALRAFLLKNKVIVRAFSDLPDYLRITVGKPAENKVLKELILKFYKK